MKSLNTLYPAQAAGTEVCGHRHIGVWFKPFLTVTVSGFRYKDKEYAWTEVVSVKETGFFGFNRGSSIYHAQVRLSDGQRISLECRALERANVKPKVNFWTTKTDAYEQLLEKFERAL